VARFGIAVAVGALLASAFEGGWAALEPPRAEAGYLLLTWLAAAVGTLPLQVVATTLGFGAVRGLAAESGTRAAVGDVVRAIRGDAEAALQVLPGALRIAIFAALAGAGFVAVAIFSEDGVATPELRAPFAAILDLGVVALATLVARAVTPAVRLAASSLEARRGGIARLLLRVGIALALSGLVLGVVFSWDFLVTLDRRLGAAGLALLVGLGAAALAFRRAGPVSLWARTSGAVLPVLLLLAGLGASRLLAVRSAASMDASIRSAGAGLVIESLRPPAADVVRPSGSERIRAPARVALPDSVPTPKHLVFLSIDALRADRLGCYGYRRRPTSPVIDRLARRGAVFEEAHAQSTLSLRSIPAAFTGLYPHAISWKRYMPGRVMPAPEKNLPVADILRESGFRTLAVLHTRYIQNEGLLQGFDDVLSDPPARDVRARARELRAERFVTRAIEHLESRPPGDDRLFLWMHFIEPHGPYNRVPDFRWGDADPDRYDAEIRYTDRALGRFVEALQRMGIAEDALFVLFADHGEEFGEHGIASHGRSLYRAGTRIPLVFWGPGVRPGRLHNEVGLVDVLPTVLGLLRIRTPHVHGSSLVRSLTEGVEPPLRTIASQLYPTRIAPPTLVAAQRDGWKLLAGWDLEPRELYHVAEDPEERRNLVVANPAVREALRADLAAIHALGAQPSRARARRR